MFPGNLTSPLHLSLFPRAMLEEGKLEAEKGEGRRRKVEEKGVAMTAIPRRYGLRHLFDRVAPVVGKGGGGVGKRGKKREGGGGKGTKR